MAEVNPAMALATASLAAIVGDACAFPLDTLKVRMQKNSYPLVEATRGLWAEGIPRIFQGISASAFRQATYGGMRLSIYEPIRNKITGRQSSSSAHVPFYAQAAAGALSGAIASALMNPADLVKIRLQSGDPRYTGAVDTLKTTIRTEGVLQLWRGVGPTSSRASVVAAAELGLYDAVKVWLVETQGCAPSNAVFAASSLVATVGAVVFSFPLDMAKTVMISQNKASAAATHAQAPTYYRNMGHCLAATFRERGLLGMYRGCFPSFARQITCNTVLFLSYEELKKRLWTSGTR